MAGVPQRSARCVEHRRCAVTPPLVTHTSKSAERLALEERALAAFTALPDRRKRVAVGVLRAMHDPGLLADLEKVGCQK